MVAIRTAAAQKPLMSPQATYFLAQNQLAKGETSEAINTNSAQPIEPWRWGIGAIIEHRLGHAAESQRTLDGLIDKYGPRAPGQVAQVYAWRGESEKLFEWLDRAYAQHDLSLGLLQITFPLFAARDDLRYAALLRKMNFPE